MKVTYGSGPPEQLQTRNKRARLTVSGTSRGPLRLRKSDGSVTTFERLTVVLKMLTSIDDECVRSRVASGPRHLVVMCNKSTLVAVTAVHGYGRRSSDDVNTSTTKSCSHIFPS